MPDPVTAVVGGASLIGANRSAKSAERAAQTSANAQLEAARIAAEEARFRPVGITSRFGQSQFQFDPETERLIGAGYELDPELRAIQDRIFGLTGGGLTTAEQAAGMAAPLGGAAQGLFGLGGQFLGAEYDPTRAAQTFYQEQQAMLEPTRQREEQRLASSVFGRGRAGLNVGDVGQPELFSLASARRQQDLGLAAQARERARQEMQQDIGFGAGLFGQGAGLLGQMYGIPTAALGPIQSQLGLASTIEQLGQQPLDIGAQLGGRSATAGAQAGEALLRGGLGAAQTGMQGALASSGIRYGALQDFLRQAPGMFNRPTSPSGSDFSYIAYGGGQPAAQQISQGYSYY
jgi:hypothetical protein